MTTLKRCLVVAGIAVAFFAGYLTKQSTTSVSSEPQKEEPVIEVEYEEIELEELEFDDLNCRCEYNVGDLVPCDEERAQYRLHISGSKDLALDFTKSAYFCIHDDSLDDPSKHPMMRYEYSCAVGPDGGVSGAHYLVRTSPDSATIRLRWRVTGKQGKNSYQSLIAVQPNAQGQVELSDGKLVEWEMKEYIRTDE